MERQSNLFWLVDIQLSELGAVGVDKLTGLIINELQNGFHIIDERFTYILNVRFDEVKELKRRTFWGPDMRKWPKHPVTGRMFNYLLDDVHNRLTQRPPQVSGPSSADGVVAKRINNLAAHAKNMMAGSAAHYAAVRALGYRPEAHLPITLTDSKKRRLRRKKFKLMSKLAQGLPSNLSASEFHGEPSLSLDAFDGSNEGSMTIDE